jgi:polyisoprenoid-binding protein YceI
LSANSVYAAWQLEPEQSQINFVSVKKASVGEVHSFKEITGHIDDAGKATVQIALDSVETLIPVRNERMRTLLFETANFPHAQLNAGVDVKALAQLQPGTALTQEVNVELSLHGKTVALKTLLQIVALQDDKIVVATLKPIILNLADFDLPAGVERLKEVAQLPSISLAVPVTAHLVFVKQ